MTWPNKHQTKGRAGPAQPSPSPSRPRWIGRDHLAALGFSAELVEEWLSAGVLTSPTDDGFYLRTPEFDEHFERLTARRVIGRAHLLELGATAAAIARWLHHGALRRTADRGFYEITIAALEGLRRAPGLPPPEDEVARAAAPASEPVRLPAASSNPDVSRVRLRVVPCTITRARAFVADHHRHLPPPVSGLFAVGVARGDELVGVAIVGRPVARGLQNGSTAEVTRVCTRGERNACSKLLAACRRGALALGFSRLITYTLSWEPGASLRAAGWREVAQVRGRSWSSPSRPRAPGLALDKRRWEAPELSTTRPPAQGDRIPGEESHVAI